MIVFSFCLLWKAWKASPLILILWDFENIVMLGSLDFNHQLSSMQDFCVMHFKVHCIYSTIPSCTSNFARASWEQIPQDPCQKELNSKPNPNFRVFETYKRVAA